MTGLDPTRELWPFVELHPTAVGAVEFVTVLSAKTYDFVSLFCHEA